MTLGEVIRRARNKARLSLEQLGRMVGLSKGTMSGYETGQPKSYDPSKLCEIADALNDLSILTHYCQACPVRQAIFIKQFPDLNNIRREPAIITTRLRKEMLEAVPELDTLTECYSDADFKSRPDYMEIFMRAMEQIVDVERCIEVVKFELIMSGFHSSLDLKKVYARQQAKCVEHGHHKPAQEADAA